MNKLKFIKKLEEKTRDYETETFETFRSIAEQILIKDKKIIEVYRKEFEEMLENDENFVEMWGSPTKKNPSKYKEKDFKDWLTDCLQNQTLEEIFDSIKEEIEEREIIKTILNDFETLVIDKKEDNNKYYYDLVKGNLEDLINSTKPKEDQTINLFLAMEWGFKAHEKGKNLEYAKKEFENLLIKKSNFLDDKEKMRDFKELSKEEFLKSYSYLTEEEYENTKKAIGEKGLYVKKEDLENAKVGDEIEVSEFECEYCEDGNNLVVGYECIHCGKLNPNNCEVCKGKGYIITLNTNTNEQEIQKCDECGMYEEDEDAVREFEEECFYEAREELGFGHNDDRNYYGDDEERYGDQLTDEENKKLDEKIEEIKKFKFSEEREEDIKYLKKQIGKKLNEIAQLKGSKTTNEKLKKAQEELKGLNSKIKLVMGNK